ncbi:histone-lysine N-methyltransferase SUVR3 [Prunus yedoensis var. nudiflora]|uniref:Histone-lysine N-methyltransferase SUVR3 n=1 Tax=Prunus yedoensis var. nudiflora TaxID=2094558 RepID=A0A314ZEA0_PRUYE|nr:histone-lysine N-methyltransferase SUVR3 [Prunus yedoensis var. nudiflora]
MQQTQSPPSKRNHSPSLLLQCSELVLSWLTPQELATISLTCSTLHTISKSMSLRRASDASRAFESHPIPFHNSVDEHPYAYFIYTPSQIPSSSSQFLGRQSWGSSSSAHKSNSVAGLGVQTLRFVDESGECAYGCECEACGEEGVGGDGCPCFGGFNDVVAECGPSCACGLDCDNRLTQRGIEVKLKILRDGRKGWSLYADQFIPKGRFVCEYAGELLTTKEARLRQQIYDELASGGHFSPALLVVREHLPSRKACLRYNIDATRVGNVSRFINHSCDGGNLSTALVRSSGALLPRLCFFASKDIKEDEELTFSYGEIRERSKGLQCFCGSSCCLGILPSEQT